MRVRKLSNNANKAANDVIYNNTNHEAACKYIRAAIDTLGKDAHTDIVAKESIANLSVVLLDLATK